MPDDDVISQATELAMRRYNIDAGAAQALVRQLSTHQQLPITDVAHALIARFSLMSLICSRTRRAPSRPSIARTCTSAGIQRPSP